MTNPVSDFCVYTILHPDQLHRLYKQGGQHQLTQNKPWTTAYTLFKAAQKAGEPFPIVFADATACSRLLYSATVQAMKCEEKSTTVTFSDLKPIKGNRSTQELVLRSTGNHIAPGFIRPYAICRLPAFI